MGLHRFKIAPMWLPGKNLAGHREVWGIQRELTELLGEINVSDVLTAAPHDWRHQGPRSRIIQRAGQNPGYFSCVLCNKTSQMTWKTEINLHKESKEILWSQREVRQVTSDIFKKLF